MVNVNPCQPQLFIMYASELGNCEQISDDLHKNLKKNHGTDSSIVAQAQRIAMNNYNQIQFQSKQSIKIVIFLTSSTGDGEFPENGQKFQSYLRKESSNRALSHVFYTILGLGDSNYSKYQGAPRFLDQRLLELGASKFYARAEADDATNLALVIEPWIEKLPKELKEQIKRIQNLSQADLQYLQSTQQEKLAQDEIFQATTLEDKDQSTTKYTAILIERVLICDEDDKQVYKVKLELGRGVSRERLDVGQSIKICPVNQQTHVDKIVQCLGWNKNQLIGNFTIEQMLLNQIDLTKRRLNLENLVPYFQMFTPDFEEDLAKILGQNRTRYSLLDLVTRCEPFVDGRFSLSESCLEEGLLKLQPRYYSILNDPFVDKTGDGITNECKELTLVFTLHKFKDGFEQDQLGLCTNYLATAEINSLVQCQISKNTRILQLPPVQEVEQKLLLICMGTGLVPFIGMLERIQATGRRLKVQMIYGVRNDGQSFYFGDFLSNFFAQQGADSHLYVQCSRSLSGQANTKNVTFSQGHIQESLSKFCLKKFTKVQDQSQVEPLPDANTYIIICGNKNALQKSVFENLGLSEFNKQQMQAFGKLLMELWSE